MPLPTTKKVVDKDTKAESFETVTLESDEGNRPDTTLEGLADAQAGARKASGSPPATPASCPTALGLRGLMDAKLAARRGLKPLGMFRGFAVAGCEPDEMGIGPVFAVPRLLERQGLEDRRHRSVGAERGVREPGDLLPRPARHSAGAAQRRRRRDRDRPPYGMSGARMTGHALIEGKRRGVQAMPW